VKKPNAIIIEDTVLLKSGTSSCAKAYLTGDILNINSPVRKINTIFGNSCELFRNKLIRTGMTIVEIIKNFFLPMKSEMVPPTKAPNAPEISRALSEEPEIISCQPDDFMNVGKKIEKLYMVMLCTIAIHISRKKGVPPDFSAFPKLI